MPRLGFGMMRLPENDGNVDEFVKLIAAIDAKDLLENGRRQMLYRM